MSKTGTVYIVELQKSQKVAQILDVVAIGFAEFFGTAILVFISCLGASKWIVGADLILFHSCFAAGLAVTTAIHIFGPISGAHVNPVTTVGAFIMNQIPLYMVPIYIIPQLAGSTVGYGLLMVVTPEAFLRAPEDPNFKDLPRHGIGMNIPSTDIYPSQALAMEMFITIILTFANCSSWDPRAKHLVDSVSIRFGLIVAGINLAAASYTGASMNPARSFGPALWNNDWHLHWIYWVGPLTSAVVGSLIYKYLFLNIYSKKYIETPVQTHLEL
ncbi:aquaporin-like isoform X1 [Onthophagus taurus]|uniref:aquaporin-like isoform X1 n=1 Tax=Onthophagus taurus TaxID=166361 RepID=UPI0039BE1435